MWTTTLPAQSLQITPVQVEQPWWFRVREQFRLRLHLARTELALRRAPTAQLSISQRVARQHNLDQLRRYWWRGVFPRNITDQSIRPAIRDDRGVLCAMAFLIDQSGHSDLVDDFAATDNHIRINAVRSGPLLSWLDVNGLTQTEAARVQPSYGPVISDQGIRYAIGIALTASALCTAIIELIWFQLVKRLGSVGRTLLWIVTGLYNAVVVTILSVALGYVVAEQYVGIVWEWIRFDRAVSDYPNFDQLLDQSDWVKWIVGSLVFIVAMALLIYALRKVVHHRAKRPLVVVTYVVQAVLFMLGLAAPLYFWSTNVVVDQWGMVESRGGMLIDYDFDYD